MLERWNDDKMDALAGGVTDLGRRADVLEVKVDGLSEQVDQRFEQVDKDMREQRQETKAGFERVDKRFERVDKDMRELRQETKASFERMQWTLIGVAGAIVAALIGAPHI